jgi:Ca2+-binding RTX toxin-like protein
VARGEVGVVARGGEGNDTIEGSSRGDVLDGEAGADTARGRDGDDFLGADDGADSLDGGGGKNTFGVALSSATTVTVVGGPEAEGNVLYIDAAGDYVTDDGATVATTGPGAVRYQAVGAVHLLNVGPPPAGPAGPMSSARGPGTGAR